MAFLTKSNRLLQATSTRNFKRFLSSTCSSSVKKGLVLGVYKENKKLRLTPAAEKYNECTRNKLITNLELADSEKSWKSMVFWGLEDNPIYHAVAVVNLGQQSKVYNKLELIDDELQSVRTAASDGCRALQALGFKEITIETLGHAEATAEGSILGTWKFQEFKSKKDEIPNISLLADNITEEEKKQWDNGVIKANSQNIARRLADTPSNLMTPTVFANEVCNLFRQLSIEIQAHNEEWAEKQKMGAFLSVAKGSDEPPVFLELTYSGGNKDTSPITLVGKGVTFDTGGISLKPASSMDEMRADMGGAASLIGTLNAIAHLNLPVNIKALIPLCENMPSGSAIKPGDVVFAKNGKSICVDNTDAEGRLILADALCYSSTFNPRFILDVATLTGAVRIALGNAATGVFSNSDILYNTLQKAGAKTGDRVWRLPLWNHFTKQVTEYVAFDVNNVGKGRGGGSCTAAAFLREFVPKGKVWMHLDIAGVMGPNDDTPYLAKGMTGRPTRTLIEFIRGHIGK